jgi:DNA-binding response OmpR family regulator
MATTPVVLASNDDAAVMRLYKRIFTHEGYRVVTAHVGDECLEAARQQRPDVVVLDLPWPPEAGLETLRVLRLELSLPVVLVSSSDPPDGAEALGLHARFGKPPDMDELIAAVRSALPSTINAG